MRLICWEDREKGERKRYEKININNFSQINLLPPFFSLFSHSLETVVMTEKTRIIDCFIFYNELDMLEYRLSLLYPHVDDFILVESTKTFIGNDKQLYYQENKERYAKYANKITHIIIDDFESNPKIGYEFNSYDNQWTNEMYQRNAITYGIEKINDFKPLKNTDIIMVSDLDEIIDPKCIPLIEEYLDKDRHSEIQGAIGIHLHTYYYNLRSYFAEQYTDKTRAMTYHYYLNLDILTNSNGKKVKDLNFGLRIIDSPFLPKIAGWHLSYFGSEHFIENKIKNFSHQEYNSVQYTNPEIIKKRIEKGEDLFGRELESQKLKRIEFSENPYLPPFPEGVEDVWKVFPFCL
jgi:beta-1,4-mannosyl-glycoprotein beta-1,4-N-acetylglucosaminyltransferase